MAKTFKELKKTVGKSSNLKTNALREEPKAFKDLKVSDYDFSHIKTDLENKIRFSTFESDLASIGKTVEAAANGWQPAETMKNTLSSIESLHGRLNAYNEYQKLFGGTDLTEVQNSYKSVLDGWKDLSKTYATYKSADEYNTAVKSAKEKVAEYEGMKKADLGAVQTEITGLEDILKTVNEHESNIQGLRNRQSTWQSRSRGTSDDGGYDKQIQAAEGELNKYLQSVGYENTDALKKALGEKKAYKNRAEWVQKGIEMASVGDKSSENYDKDFAKKSKYTPKDDNAFSFSFGADDDLIYDYINDADGVRKNYQDNAESSAEASVLMAGYEHMTDDEVSTYNYYYNTFGAKKAREYLDTIAEDLGARKAVADFERYEGKTTKELLQGIGAGFDQFASGMKNLFNFTDEYIPTNSVQQLSGLVREDLRYEHGTLGQVGYDLIKTTSNMLPSILTSTLVGAVNPAVGANVGAGLMGASASGNAYQEMLNLGYDKGQARTYSALVGASEATLQRVMGGIGALGGASGKLSKLVSGIDNGLAKFAIRWGGSMLSEGIEEATQEVLTPLFTNIAAGYDTGTDVDLSEVIYSGLLGALSGGILEGSGIASNSIQEASHNKRLGQAIKANERTGDMLGLIDGLTPEESEAYATYTRYANKGVTADNISNTQLGNLYDLASSDAMKVMKSETATEEQKKSAENTLRDLAAYAQKSPTSKIKAEDFDKDSLDEMIEQALTLDEDTEGYKLATQYKEKLANGKKLSTKEIKKLVSATDAVYDTEAQSDVETQLKELGETGDVAKIADAIMKEQSGKILTTEEANLIKNSKYGEYVADALTSEEIKEVEEALDNASKVMSEEEAQLFKKLYDRSVDVEDYSDSFNLVAQYAKDDYSQDTMLKNKGVLTNEQVASIYSATVIAKRQAQEKKIALAHEKLSKGMSYKGFIDDSVIDYENKSTDGKVNWSSLKPRQREAITFIKGIAKATGMNLKLVTYGRKEGFHGAFKVQSNTIVLDIYAGIDKAGKLADTLVPTFSHELTHWLKDKSPLLYRKLDEFIFKSLEEQEAKSGKEVLSEFDRVDNEQKAMKAALDREVTAEEARDEIIARACEDLLSMSEEGKKLFNSLSESEQKTLVDKIKDIIAQLKDWITDLLSTYSSRSYEATLLREYESALNEMSKMWDEMLADAVKNNQAFELSGEYRHKTDGEITTIGARDLTEFSVAEGVDGKTLFQYRAMVEDEDIYREMLLKHKDTIGISAKQINDLFGMIDKAVDIISNNLEVLDYAWEADINDRAFVPVKPNSDSLYKVSLDFSTLCRKRLLQQTIQATLQEALNKQLSKEEAIAIRDELIKVQEEGRQIEVACALCYVESARMKSPAQITKFLNNREAIIREFFANRSGGSIKEKVKNAEMMAREKLKKANPDGLLGKNGVILDALSAPKNAMLKADADYLRAEGKKAKTSYELTEHEQAELDVALSLGVDGFTSAKGLENLAKHHRDLFDAYTSFVRNATHSKGIENDTWWRAGDSANIGDTLIAQMNSENGLRSQSWSDFQVIHLLDYIAATIELSTKGAKRQSYTKVPDYVKLLGNTGDMINMSVIPEREFSGKLGYDSVEGMPYQTAKKLREQYHETAGIICIGVDDTQIRMLLADDTIDMVIPYHHSGMSKDTRKLMHIPTWITYEKSQNETNLSDADAQARAKEYGVKLNKDAKYQKAPKFSEWFNIEEARQIAKMENENPSDTKAHKKYGTMYGAYKAMQNAANNYLKLCAERGLAPKFSQFTTEDNYWKLLTDRKMVDNVTGELIEQKPIKPIFNEKHILEILNDELARYPQVKADQEYATRKVVEKFLSGEMKVDESTLEAIRNTIDNVTEVNILESMEDVKLSHRDDAYSYDELIKKPDMKLTVLSGPVPNNRADIINQAKKNAARIGKVNPKNNTISIFVNDVGKDVIIGTDGLKHGLRRLKGIQNNPNSIVTLKAGEILKNSIRINELTPSKESATSSYVLIGAATDTNGNMYIVRSVVNEYNNELASIDVLYAVNTKKELAVLNAPRYANNSLSVTSSTISIASLLDYVNKYFPDILPESVLRHYGYDERPIGELGEDALFSLRDNDLPSAHELMGEAERLKKENEKLRQDFESLQERLKIERQITNGNYFNENQLGAAAGHLRSISNSLYPKLELMKRMKDVYSYIAQTGEYANQDGPVFEVMFDKAYNIAVDMLNDAKPEVQVDDYVKSALKDIRKMRISLSQTQIEEAKYRFGNNYQRMFFGNVILAKDGIPLDSVWGELSSMYPAWFDRDTTEGDQIGALYDAIEEMKSASEMIVEYNADEQARWLATEIYNQYWNVSNIKTTADKYDKKIKQLNFDHRNRIQMLREDYNARLKEQHKSDKTKYQKLAEKIRENRDKKISEAKEHGKERLAQYRENAERKTRIQRITQNALTLNEWLVKNSKDKHIHESLKGPVVALLNAIDFSSKRLLDKGTPTKKDISLSQALNKVQMMMVNASNGKEELVELYGHGLDEDIKELIDSVDNIMRDVGDNEFILHKMTLTDLKTLDNMVRTIKHSVSKMNKFHVVHHAKGIANLSQESMEYLDSLGKEKVYDGLRGATKKLLNWNNALPYYAFKRYGSGGMKIYEALQDGWDKFAFNTKAIIDYANEAYSSKDVNEWSESIKSFRLLLPATEYDLNNPDYKPQYQTIQMTIPQIMSLYCLQKREQAKGHILGGGIRIADFKDSKGRIISQSDGVVLTASDVATLIDSLTDKQRTVADKLQQFMNTTCTDWGNEVSMLRFGYKAFGEENYFPIQSDDNNLSVNDATEQPNSLFRLLNMSFTKSTIDKANNRVVISDIFDVFAQHTSDMAKYNALALPVLDAFKWYNYTEKQDIADGAFKTMGVKQSIESAFGKDGKSYFTTFLKDINGQQEVSRDTLGKHFFSNAKIAAVGANLRVMALQPTSYVRASAVIDNKYLMKALGHKPKIKKAEEHCGIALWKSMGYYDTNIQRGVEAQIKHNDTWKDKVAEKSMKGAEIADKITWGYLWNACELEVRETRKDLKVGSKEFYETIGKRLREIIYATQVVDSTMTRSQLMRGNGLYEKQLTAFASEPTLAYNMLQDAYMSLHLDARRMGKKEALKKNGKRIARVLTAYTLTNAVAALVESGFDAWRDDDEEDKNFEYFMKLYLTNFLSDMSITGKIPYIKELHSIIKGFGSSRSDTQWMESFGYALKGWYKIFTGEGSASKTIKHSLKATSDIVGLPFYSAYRDIMATLDMADILTAEDLNEMFEDFFN